MFFGVAGGLGEYTGIDATVVRLIFVLGTLLGFGSFFIIYLVMVFVVPEEPVGVLSTTPLAQTGADVYEEPLTTPEETTPPQEP
jgi:phage shock protein PspC (stress-responsive transcriptional regulator)